MKLQCVFEGSIYGVEYRSVLVESRNDSLTQAGRIPVPANGLGRLRFLLRTDRRLRSIVERVVGEFPTVNLWPVTPTTFVASADQWLLVSTDGGDSWRTSRQFPPSSGPMGVLPTGFCQRNGSWYVGEYPLAGDTTPRVLRSDDEGASWSTEHTFPAARHIHSVQTDPYTGDLWVTTGDSGAGCSISRFRDGERLPLGQGDQRWRAVELAFTPSAILWGVDSVYEPTKPIRKVDRDQLDRPQPEVQTVHELSSSVFYSTTLDVDGTSWVVFSTAEESGADSTAPQDRQQCYSDGASVVAASSESGFTRWHEIRSWQKQYVPSDAPYLRNYLPAANAYVYLASDSERGVFLNPYNTEREAGDVITFPPSYFDSLE